MATVQERNGSFRILFCHQDRRLTFTVGRISRAQADAHAKKVDELLALLGDGTLSLPEGVDVVAFMLHKGKPPAQQSQQAAVREPTTFRRLCDEYLAVQGNGAMEANSLGTTRMHLGHFARTLGEDFLAQNLALTDLQRHVNERRKKKYRGKLLSPVTLKKEVATFRAAWNWAALTGLVKGVFPSKGLVYPKADEKPPFMTWPEIERRVRAGVLTKDQIDELWDALYLRKEEIELFLAHVKERATQPWVYPLCCAAAHTGARRSELLRIQVADVDFDGGTVLIREKKRSRKQRTTRHVSLSPFLAGTLRDWLTVHPGGPYLFCQQGVVARSKKRSRTTGHRAGKSRPTTLAERLAGVRRREPSGLAALTKDEAHDHFKRTLAGSKWEVLRGYHVLRHSFISCLAASGVDQRIIDEFVGHQTDEQRRRYRHLVPDAKQKAIAGVFG